MKKFALEYICKMEGYKTAIKDLHWDADNLSQHKLCDDIADEIKDFQDVVSEIEQALDGNLPFNELQGTKYKVTNLKDFLNDVIKETISFYKTIGGKGDDYIGMRSECETFIAAMQKNIYLTRFTLKEDFERRYINKSKVNENKVQLNDGGIKYTLTESELKNIIKEAMINSLKK